MNDLNNRLTARVEGPVYTAQTDGYDDERTGFQLLDPHRPAVIVGATGTADVQTAVEAAAAHRVPVAVQATGHGLAAPTDGVLINTSRMSGVWVHPDDRTAWVEAGATWSDVIAAAAPHGLAPLSGSLPGVGAVSYTLGGGIGLLARRYGFAADHISRIDLVTPDGRLRRVTADSDPDLFWALGGGGGNFGVATGMLIDLVPVTRIYGGSLYFDVEEEPGVPEAWLRWTADLPEEMTSAVTIMPFPDLPMLPEPLRGRHIAQIQISYLGAPEDGDRLVKQLRLHGPLVLDTVRDIPFTESGAIFDEPDQPHAYRSRNALVDKLDPQALTDLTKTCGPAAPVMTVVGVRHLGGALARSPRIPNAIGHRNAAYSVSVLSPVPNGAEDTVRAAHYDALKPFAPNTVGCSLNFTFGALTPDEIRSAFAPADYERLTGIKAQYDPHGLLRPNHPISSPQRVR
ncbi:FAD-binding oxidoreductase [Nocardia transvalensis]|uniref:FAD-binding oxidoreductase n=1 Tax=Nocardia transvalensis TaxID=37333 RepID=UPI001895D892|nr:FAD-binding oxidoreductase [Nocardia transvalensis]MBF6327061.1 FAD-binding oxidoreductase [Nocardia transvalensis]